ncbi:deoxyribodipyrimidine photo-lyase [Microlunatus sp. Gsoil 973]|uniref:cryptochrome/photolyase family protein n=1 Tax=Microlunatus sp. Gsoil 973 TaxID=2672569 RepID=UPI0012B48366|nr:deoxyribodipyrimidine photo-lyase [Microlunatus sp. Gsoil 973]QGN34339.1 deoxyribodipyrimidine photo-lyase [Microlunatus sp. Gsoil 973]
MSERRIRIAVFTRDLRVNDNPVLAAAANADRTIPVFVQDPTIEAVFGNEHRQQFLDAGLADLDRSLRELGAGLVVRRGDPVTEIGRLAERFDVESVHIAADVSGHARSRERRLERALAAQRRRLVVHEAAITVHPVGDITPTGSDHFSVFGPYFRRWQEQLRRPLIDVPERIELPDGLGAASVPRGRPAHAWPGGESAARERANAWFADGLATYHDVHDDLAADKTSKLSPYLHLGNLSPVELVTRAAERPTAGSEAFIRQLAWRDFHHQVLAARPGAAWNDYRNHDDRWNDPGSLLDAWRAGQTGYPLVDAGMRQLSRTGWMHNRARLVTGSFLTKTLYLDWRHGARHFLGNLVDGDLANNNLNWQWVAGTGTDTRPNRVLNPLRQGERFDKDANYVRRWLPELSGIADARDAREPWRLPADRRRTVKYTEPVVDLAAGRQQFLISRGGGR